MCSIIGTAKMGSFLQTTNFLDIVKRAISDTLCIAVFGTVPVNTLKILKVRQQPVLHV